jgi:hypothetical protein
VNDLPLAVHLVEDLQPSAIYHAPDFELLAPFIDAFEPATLMEALDQGLDSHRDAVDAIVSVRSLRAPSRRRMVTEGPEPVRTGPGHSSRPSMGRLGRFFRDGLQYVPFLQLNTKCQFCHYIMRNSIIVASGLIEISLHSPSRLSLPRFAVPGESPHSTVVLLC